MAISHATYEQVALEDSDTTWEYVCGQLREKPGMTQEHNSVAFSLAMAIARQLPRDKFEVRNNSGRLRTSAGNAFVPDVVVIPIDAVRSQVGTRKLETYDEAVPFVAETWSRSTGTYDSNTKIPEYKARGDLEIWRVLPYDRLVQAMRRQPDSSYVETEYSGGTVAITSLGISVDFDEVFGRA
jgi:hypothetical protein